ARVRPANSGVIGTALLVDIESVSGKGQRVIEDRTALFHINNPVLFINAITDEYPVLHPAILPYSGLFVVPNRIARRAGVNSEPGKPRTQGLKKLLPHLGRLGPCGARAHLLLDDRNEAEPIGTLRQINHRAPLVTACSSVRVLEGTPPPSVGRFGP